MEMTAQFIVIGVPSLIILARHYRQKIKDRASKGPVISESGMKYPPRQQ